MKSLPISLIITSSGEPFILYTKIINTLRVLDLFSNVYIIVDCNFRLNSMYDDLFVFLVKMMSLLRGKGNFIIVKNYENSDGHARLLETMRKLEKLNKYVFLSEDDDYIINPELLEKSLNDAINDDVDVMGPPEETIPERFNSYFKKIVDRRPDLIVENAESPYSAFKLNTGFATTNYLIKRKFIKRCRAISKYFKFKCFDKENEDIIIDGELVIPKPHEVITLDRSGLWTIKLYNDKFVRKLRYVNKTIRNYIDVNKVKLDESINYHFRFGHNIYSCDLFSPEVRYDIMDIHLKNFDPQINLNNFVYHWLLLMKELLLNYKDCYNFFDYYDTYIKNVNDSLIHSYNFVYNVTGTYDNLYKDINDNTKFEKYNILYEMSKKIICDDFQPVI